MADGKWDEVKGNAKEKTGQATDDESLENEGKGDQAKGNAKQAWDKAKDAADDVKS